MLDPSHVYLMCVLNYVRVRCSRQLQQNTATLHE